MATKAIGYIRVSLEKQAEKGVSLDAQKERIEAWAKYKGRELLDVHVDAGLSGGRADNRPGLNKALDQVCAEKGVLVVYSLSRLARSTKDAIAISERLKGCGADLVSLSEEINTSTAAGKLFYKVLAALFEFERDVIAERTSEALQHMRRQGLYTGGRAPFGFKLEDGNLVPVEREQKGLRRARRLRKKGLSLRAVASDLYERKLTDKLLSAQAMKDALSR